MISLDEAQQRVLQLAVPVATDCVPLYKAVGRYAAEDVFAKRAQPARDVSAMDGYAVRSADGRNLRIVCGESAAGAPYNGTIGKNEAARIFTGAALPRGADSVIIQENVIRQNAAFSLVEAATNPKPYMNIRQQATDFAINDLIIAAGERLTPARIGLLAASGHAHIKSTRPITVALLSTGNELVAVGTDTPDDRLPASNALMIAALIAHLPVDVIDLGIAPDEETALKTAINWGHGADILVTIGGASVGDYDLVQPVLKNLGAKLDFWKVAMRPGKPLLAGKLGAQIVLGLPGNPVSAYVTALQFLCPLIAALSGAANPRPPRIRLPLGAPLGVNGDRTDHVRATLRDGQVFPISSQDSAGLRALARANALIIRMPFAPPATVGEHVEIIAT